MINRDNPYIRELDVKTETPVTSWRLLTSDRSEVIIAICNWNVENWQVMGLQDARNSNDRANLLNKWIKHEDFYISVDGPDRTTDGIRAICSVRREYNREFQLFFTVNRFLLKPNLQLAQRRDDERISGTNLFFELVNTLQIQSEEPDFEIHFNVRQNYDIGNRFYCTLPLLGPYPFADTRDPNTMLNRYIYTAHSPYREFGNILDKYINLRDGNGNRLHPGDKLARRLNINPGRISEWAKPAKQHLTQTTVSGEKRWPSLDSVNKALRVMEKNDLLRHEKILGLFGERVPNSHYQNLSNQLRPDVHKWIFVDRAFELDEMPPSTPFTDDSLAGIANGSQRWYFLPEHRCKTDAPQIKERLKQRYISQFLSDEAKKRWKEKWDSDIASNLRFFTAPEFLCLLRVVIMGNHSIDGHSLIAPEVWITNNDNKQCLKLDSFTSRKIFDVLNSIVRGLLNGSVAASNSGFAQWQELT
jgi:hypothetical protein